MTEYRTEMPPESMAAAVPGLSYLDGFVGAAEQAALLEAIDAGPWRTDLKRRVQHYGYRYDYRARSVSENDALGPLPEWLLPSCRRLVEWGVFSTLPDQVIVNEYLPGQGIAAHTDCVPCFGATIASLSLGAPITLALSETAIGAGHAVRLAPRSLLVLSGPARSRWRHGIAARRWDVVAGVRVRRERRVSVTFRTLARPLAGR